MTTRRIDVLDVLRGIAIMGTLGTNIWIFTDPLGPAGVMDALSGSGTAEIFLHFLANGKFLALLSLLFGVGMELQYRSAVRRGVTWPGRYLWRAALLFVEGLLHYVLIFEFDVLMGYAVVSVLVAFLIGRSDRVVKAWMIATGTVFTAVIGLVTLALLYGVAGLSSGAAPSRRFAEGGYLDQVTARIVNMGTYRFEAVFIVPLGVVLFLLGSRLVRAGVFEDSERGVVLRRRLMVLGLGVGVPLNLLTAFSGEGWFLVDRYLLPPLVALGLLGLVTAVALRAGDVQGRMRRGLTAVGRTALSCYVFQNLAGAVLCYGWGLGLATRFEELRPWWTVGAWAAICAAFMALATLWLRRFERGPLEILWQRAYLMPWRPARETTVTDDKITDNSPQG
ncbi:DUF418 domain-containing protein [Streptosporangium sp. NPDC001559]|uniref:DUF418 domain-containing protein n=1 Tax=Streptosporangium sp. NPDC001559 TaxID=3366187 RepID=UPI0036EFF620